MCSILIFHTSDFRVCDVLIDAANAWAFSLSDIDEATSSPFSSPGVLYDVVSASGGISAVSNGNDGVIHGSAAIRAGNNAA
jgi:hypothetical protein